MEGVDVGMLQDDVCDLHWLLHIWHRLDLYEQGEEEGRRELGGRHPGGVGSQLVTVHFALSCLRRVA